MKNKSLNSSNSLNSNMRNRSLIFLFLFLFSLTFISAEAISQRQDAQLDQPYIISQPCATCTYINISVFTENGVVLDNVPMADNGSTWTYTFTPNESVRYDVNGIGDINGNDDSFAFYFYVEPINVGATVFMLSFFCSLILGVAVLHKRINFEAWYNKIQTSDKTFIKSSLAGVPYILMKNVFLIYYLIGFPIIFLVTDLINYFNISSIAYMFQIFSNIYTVGLVLPGILLLGDTVKILYEIYENIENNNWGVS